MPRTIDGTVQAQFSLYSNTFRFAVLVDISFVSETVHAWTGLGSFVWNGNTYIGVGQLGTISAISEDSTVQAQNVTLTLDGIEQGDLMEVLNDYRQGQPVNVWVAIFQPDGQTLVGPPVLAFAGLTDQPTLTESPETATISISLENRMIQLQRPNERRYTQNQQQLLYPNDQGFNYVSQAACFVGSWGQSS